MKYNYIWFDLGMTLLNLERAIPYQKVLGEFGVERTVEEIELAYHMTDKLFMRAYPHVLGQVPENCMPWYLGQLNFALGAKLDIITCFHRNEQLRKELPFTPWKCFPHTVETLETLKAKGYKIGLISNWDLGCRQLLQHLNILQYFDTIIISSEVGCAKPDPKIFEVAFAQSGGTAENALYIGDNYYDDVLGTAKVGMDCLLVNAFDRQGIEELDYDKVISHSGKVLDFLEL